MKDSARGPAPGGQRARRALEWGGDPREDGGVADVGLVGVAVLVRHFGLLVVAPADSTIEGEGEVERVLERLGVTRESAQVLEAPPASRGLFWRVAGRSDHGIMNLLRGGGHGGINALFLYARPQYAFALHRKMHQFSFS